MTLAARAGPIGRAGWIDDAIKTGMIMALILPSLNERAASARIESFYPAPDRIVRPGEKLLDVCVDLSAIVLHDCPPVSYFRLATRERAWLRRVLAAPGQEVEAGAALALFSTDPAESLDAVPHRALRVSAAGIVRETDWWSPDAT